MFRAAFLTSSFARIAFWLLAAGLSFFVSGCGFEPVYGTVPPGRAEAFKAGILVDPVPDRLGQQFRIALEKQLNPSGTVPANPRYRLTVSLSVSESGIGTARDGTISRYNVYLDSNYTLMRVEDDAIMLSGGLRQVSSYNNIVNEYFSTKVAQEDAYRRGVEALAQQYRQRLISYLTEHNGNPKPRGKTEPQPPFPVPQNPADPNAPGTSLENLYGIPVLAPPAP